MAPASTSLGRAGRGAGFTLLELLVAIAVAALLLTAVPAMLSRGLATMEYRSEVRELVAGLKGARRAAMDRGESVAFWVDTAARRFGTGTELDGEIPADLQVELTVAETEVESPERGAIRFYPDGSATGGSIQLLRPGGGGVRLRVDWLLGRISQEPPEPR
ncbi:MAG: pilus assembly FimT family protein [Pseudomonadota bacterium]